jgi:hypothetical protein
MWAWSFCLHATIEASISEPKGREAAQQTKLPRGQTHDDSNCGQTLCPGVMISSEAYEGDKLPNTAGIPVRKVLKMNVLSPSLSHGFTLGLEDLRIGDGLFMDNPFSGRCEGLVTRIVWVCNTL